MFCSNIRAKLAFLRWHNYCSFLFESDYGVQFFIGGYFCAHSVRRDAETAGFFALNCLTGGACSLALVHLLELDTAA